MLEGAEVFTDSEGEESLKQSKLKVVKKGSVLITPKT